MYDLIIVGAGPSGLACAIEAERLGLQYLVLEKGCLVDAIYRFPVNMVFFTTPELLEIGDLPLVCARDKPTRQEVLQYYRKVAERYKLQVHQYQRVIGVAGSYGEFTVSSLARDGARRHHGRAVVVATGYYDLPNTLGVSGEELPKVAHYYSEPHSFWRRQVAVIGGANSAAEAALELYRAGAAVTLVHRGEGISPQVKYWVRPDIENRIKAGQIKAYFRSVVRRIAPDALEIETPHGLQLLANDFVFALIGYRPDVTFLRSMGVEVDQDTLKPRVNPETFETNVPGLYLAGSVMAGRETGKLFIENGRFHGQRVVADLALRLGRRKSV